MDTQKDWEKLTAAVTLMVTRPGSSDTEVAALVGGVVHQMLAQVYERYQAFLASMSTAQAVRHMLEQYLRMAGQVLATGYAEVSRCTIAINQLPAPDKPGEIELDPTLLMSTIFHQIGLPHTIALQNILLSPGDGPLPLYAVLGQLDPKTGETEALLAAGPDTPVYEVSFRRIQ